ncbi:hypothetical protein KR50_12550 [Jeotgalibacillus campisalis]|uniref:Uncharacterized protein n=1 Tax=Jeotgalibacillus campisalis TaxID=220754 RepID=A0A0C2REK1_9BACL|nr:hypothetical protein KR50_12550 [Jeotgalibacillus campisalis]
MFWHNLLHILDPIEKAIHPLFDGNKIMKRIHLYVLSFVYLLS